MQQETSTQKISKITGARIGIIFSKWYPEYVGGMVNACERTLLEMGAAHIEKHKISGSLELPLAAKCLLQQEKTYDAIVAFGVILKGDTFHFEMISNECSRGLGAVSLEFTVPILNEVLAVNSIDHAKARSGDDKFNKGIEAAVAAAETIAWRRELKKGGERSLGF